MHAYSDRNLSEIRCHLDRLDEAQAAHDPLCRGVRRLDPADRMTFGMVAMLLY